MSDVYDVPIVSRRRPGTSGAASSSAPLISVAPLPPPIVPSGKWNRENRTRLVTAIRFQVDRSLRAGEMGRHVFGELDPASITLAFDTLFERRRQPSAHFLDIGAGMGAPTVAAAVIYGAKATGIEIVGSLFERAAAIYAGDPRIKFIAGDATTMDFSDATHVYTFHAGFDPSIKRIIYNLIMELPNLMCALIVDYPESAKELTSIVNPNHFGIHMSQFSSTGRERFVGTFIYPRRRSLRLALPIKSQ